MENKWIIWIKCEENKRRNLKKECINEINKVNKINIINNLNELNKLYK